jgi:pimeloyl-ACP methyl ester carboxylesterase
VNTRISRRYALRLFAGAPLALLGSASAANRRIDESGFVSIGGIEQWIGIQGRDARNPAILYLHGGPAEAQSPFLKEFIPWEDDFTVVNWDQRGAGKTFGKNGVSTPGFETPESALHRMCEDVREVAQYACQRLKQKKVILVGQSWGTVLGLRAARQWPELFHAFVGTAFFVSWSDTLRGVTSATRAQATTMHDQAALDALDKTAALPETDMARFITANKYRWAPTDLEYLEIQQAFVGAPPLPEHGEVADWVNAGGFSIPKLMPILIGYDARKGGLDIPVPFFIAQGRNDHVTPLDAAEAFVRDVRAPRKACIPLTGGHFACFTDSAGFVSALRQHVRPLVR